jgi:diaminohydroxyphosphoribosylaminopyrimidine deaminase/5-amino-6-(5-phosphoribosylamino)uracil reductase
VAALTDMTPMARALRLARQALGSTSPNPAVGAVVSKEGVVLGEGYTQPLGGGHAEIGALRQAGESSRGADLYTTLEPCCTFGRTPPCTRAIIGAGIRRVYLAVEDPNPLVLGKGRRELEAAGVQVQVSQGKDAETAGEIYQGFAKHINTGLPFVTAKFAMSLDGKIAAHTGDSKWITGPEARVVAQQLRRESDVVMVGISTVLADDPQLTARDRDGGPLTRQPLRVVLDSAGRTPTTAKLLQEPGKTVIAVCLGAPVDKIVRLEDAGAEVIQAPPDPDGRVDMNGLLEELGRRGVVNLMVEGGGIILGSLFDGGRVDKVMAFVAPVIIGGSGAASPVEGAGISRMADAWRLERTKMEQVGGDWIVTGYPKARG